MSTTLNYNNIYVTHGHGSLSRYVKLRVAYATGILGTSHPHPHFKGNRKLAIPTWCITARAHGPWCICISRSLTSGGGENVPGIPGACATRNFTYLARGPWSGPIQTPYMMEVQITCFCVILVCKVIIISWRNFDGRHINIPCVLYMSGVMLE